MLSKNILASTLAITTMITGCSSGGTGNTDGTDSTKLQETTSFTVTVDAPDSLQKAQETSAMSSFLMSTTDAVTAADLKAENFAVVDVDTAGIVTSIVPVSGDALTFNEANDSWTITVSGKQRLDRLVVVDINNMIDVAFGQALPDNTLYRPLIQEELNINLASTAAYDSFLEQMNDAMGFADQEFAADNELSQQALAQMIRNAEQRYDDLVGSDFLDVATLASVDDVLERLEGQIEDTIAQAVSNQQEAEEAVLADAFAQAQRVYRFEGELPNAPAYRIFSTATTEQLFRYGKDDDPKNPTSEKEFTEEMYDSDSPEGALVLTDTVDSTTINNSGWKPSTGRADTVVQSDGAVRFNEVDVLVSDYRADRVINLAGKNIAEFLLSQPAMQMPGLLVNQVAEFPDEAKSFPLNSRIMLEDTYQLPCADPLACVLYPVPYTSDFNESGVMLETFIRDAVASSASDLVGFMLEIQSVNGGSTAYVAELLSTSNQVNIYRVTTPLQTSQSLVGLSQEALNTSQLEKVAESTWQYRTPDNLLEGQRVITFPLSEEVRSTLNQSHLLDDYPVGSQMMIANFPFGGMSLPLRGRYEAKETAIKLDDIIFNQVAGDAITTAFEEKHFSDIDKLRRLTSEWSSVVFSALSNLELNEILLCAVGFDNSTPENPLQLTEAAFNVFNEYCRGYQRRLLAKNQGDGENSNIPDVVKNAKSLEFISTDMISDQSLYFAVDTTDGNTAKADIELYTFSTAEANGNSGTVTIQDVDEMGDLVSETIINGRWEINNGELIVTTSESDGTRHERFELMMETQLQANDAGNTVFSMHRYSVQTKTGETMATRGNVEPVLVSGDDALIIDFLNQIIVPI